MKEQQKREKKKKKKEIVIQPNPQARQRWDLKISLSPLLLLPNTRWIHTFIFVRAKYCLRDCQYPISGSGLSSMSHGNSASKVFVRHILYQLFCITTDTSVQLEQMTSGDTFQPEPFCDMQTPTSDSQKTPPLTFRSLVHLPLFSSHLVFCGTKFWKEKKFGQILNLQHSSSTKMWSEYKNHLMFSFFCNAVPHYPYPQRESHS